MRRSKQTEISNKPECSRVGLLYDLVLILNDSNQNQSRNKAFVAKKTRTLEGKYSLESTDPRESEIRAPPQPLPYLMPIPPTRFFYNK